MRVTEVKDVEGHASIIANRGKLKRPFEFKLELTWEVAGSELTSSIEGTISVCELSPAPTGHAKAVTYEASERFVRAPQGPEAMALARPPAPDCSLSWTRRWRALSRRWAESEAPAALLQRRAWTGRVALVSS